MVTSTRYANPEDVYNAIQGTNQSDRPQVIRIISTVESWIDRYLNRADYGFKALTVATANVFAGNGKPYLYLPDFIELSTVKMKTSISESTYNHTYASGDIIPFRGDPKRPNYNKLPYHGIIVKYSATYPYFTNGELGSVSHTWNMLHPDTQANSVSEPTVQVTAKWGYAETVPPIITEVTIMEAIRLYKQERAGMGDAGFNARVGETEYVKGLHPTAKVMLDMSNLKRPKITGSRY